MEKLTDELEAQLRQQHGEIVVAKTKHGDLAFRCPTDVEHEDFQEGLGKPKANRSAVFRQYCLAACVFPKSREAAAAIFEKLPALPAKLTDVLSDLAGFNVEITVKKG